MGRRRSDVLDKVAAGTYRERDDARALCERMGVNDPREALARARAELGLTERGPGRPRKSRAKHRRDRTRPHYSERPKPQPRRHIIYPHGARGVWEPDMYAIGMAFEAAWTDELAAEWPEELVRGVIMPPQMVAHHAIIDYCRCWQRYDGPEFADDIGIARDVIEQAYGRPPRPHAENEIATLPTPEIMVELLREGWLSRWWTQPLDEPLNGQSLCDVKVG